jgi:hypothetical protein
VQLSTKTSGPATPFAPPNPIRTIVDIAPRRTDRPLIRLVQDARIAKHLNDTALRRLLLRCPRLQRLIDPTQNPTRSKTRGRLRRLDHQTQTPHATDQHQAQRQGGRRSVRNGKLIVELDGWPYHSGREAFYSDQQRDSNHRTLGFDTVRYTGEQLTDVEAANLRRRLSR